MTLVRLRLTLPEGSWVADVSRTHPETTFRVLGAIPGDETGFALISVVAESPESTIESIRAHEAVSLTNTVQRSEGRATIQVDTGRPLILEAAKRTGLPIEPPFPISDGEARVDVAGSRERISEFSRRLEDANIGCEIEFAGRRDHADQLLTDTQRELVLTAIERGHYDVPRECTLTELADHAGIAKSTCSETLQRAESRLVRRFIRRLSDDPEAPEQNEDDPVDGGTDTDGVSLPGGTEPPRRESQSETFRRSGTRRGIRGRRNP